MAVPRGLKALIALVLITGALWSACHRDPWDPDETRYLQITREMLDRGDPMLLHLNGEPYSDKPPLFFWTLAPSVALLGHDSALAGMLPSLLAFFALMVAAWRLGRAAGLEPRAVEWGVVMLATSLLPAVLLGGCRMDLLFSVWCALTLEQLIRCGRHDASRRNHYLAWLWISLGVLTKGPLALALPVLAGLALAAEQRRPLVRLVKGPGVLLAVGVVAIWLVPAALQAGWSWFESIALHQTAGRLSNSFAHQEPWWYHIATVPLTMLPWSILVLPASIAALSRRQALPAPGRLIAIYPLTSMVLLSLLSGKTFLYPLPIFAPACLVAAWWLLRSPQRWSRRLALVAAGLLACLLGAAMWFAVAPHPDMQLGPLAATALSLSIGGPGLVAIVAALRGSSRHAAVALALAVPMLISLGLQPVITGFDRLLSLRPLGQTITREANQRGLAVHDQRDPSDPATAVYAKLQPGLLLFTNERFAMLDSQQALEEALMTDTIVAINIKDARRLEPLLAQPWEVLAEVPYRHTSILLIAGDRSAESPATEPESEPTS